MRCRPNFQSHGADARPRRWYINSQARHPYERQLRNIESKGLVNNREHLESLIEAMDSGITSLQEYMEKSRDRTEPKAMEQTS